MPSFSRPLEETLHRAVHYANARRHEYATLHPADAAVVQQVSQAVVNRGQLQAGQLGQGFARHDLLAGEKVLDRLEDHLCV